MTDARVQTTARADPKEELVKALTVERFGIPVRQAQPSKGNLFALTSESNEHDRRTA